MDEQWETVPWECGTCDLHTRTHTEEHPVVDGAASDLARVQASLAS